MSSVSMSIRGDQHVLASLQRLGRRILPVVRGAGNRNLTPRRKEIAKASPAVTGALSRAWGKQVIPNPSIGEITASLGIRKGWKDPTSGKIPQLYAGRVHKKNPFALRSWEGNASRTISGMRREVGKGIEKEATRRA